MPETGNIITSDDKVNLLLSDGTARKVDHVISGNTELTLNVFLSYPRNC
ncbi:hypothetical protein [Paenibacillus sp. yr247]|nr:hypothetical protein [Paenibacillus sp. yr247]